MRDGGAGKRCKRAVQMAGAMICKYALQIRTANTHCKYALQIRAANVRCNAR